MQTEYRQYAHRLWPIGLYTLVVLLGDSAVAYYMESGGMPDAFMITAIVGFMFGQFGSAAILGGLVGRSWVAGWLLVCGLTAAAMAMYLIGVAPHNLRLWPERIALAALIPLLSLAACAPLMMMRGLRGWSLTWDDRISIQKERGSIEDLLLLSVIVACSISMLRIVTAFSRGFQESHGLVIASVFFAFSLLFLVPATFVTFRTSSWGRRLLGWGGVAAAAAVGCIVVAALTAPRSDLSLLWDALWYVAVGIASCALTMILGTSAILASGLRMTRYAKTDRPPAADANPWQGTEDEAPENAVPEKAAPEKAAPEDEQAESGVAVGPRASGATVAAARRGRRQARLLTGGVAVATLLVSVWLNYSDQRRVRFFDSTRQVVGYAGGAVRIWNDQVVSVTAGHDTTDDNFYRFKQWRDIERLSLADSRVTDRIVSEFAGFPTLRRIDLSGTQISDLGLEHMQRHLRLNELSVAKTRVTLAKVIEVARAMGVQKLDIGHLDIDDRDLEPIGELKSLHTLSLRGNPVTDAGIAKLLQALPSLAKLDLRNTQVDGSGLLSPASPNTYTLLLDGTKITDANLIKIMKAKPSSSISIKNTSVTRKVLPVALATQTILSLGSGSITEQDVMSVDLTGFRELGLNGPEFTGSSLGTLAQVRSLDMSYSGVTDAAFTRLRMQNAGYGTALNLAHTDVTDAILPTLQQMSCYELDLRFTGLTARGLLQHLVPGSQITITVHQFTPAEMVALNQQFTVNITDEPGWAW